MKNLKTLLSIPWFYLALVLTGAAIYELIFNTHSIRDVLQSAGTLFICALYISHILRSAGKENERTI
jgi:hypothetical protein